MNLKKFTPDNNSAGELDEGQVIGSFFLKTDQQFAKTGIVKHRLASKVGYNGLKQRSLLPVVLISLSRAIA